MSISVSQFIPPLSTLVTITLFSTSVTLFLKFIKNNSTNKCHKWKVTATYTIQTKAEVSREVNSPGEGCKDTPALNGAFLLAEQKERTRTKQ